MVGNRDNLVVPADWTFHSKNVADNFDMHVREQLPWYELATGIAAHFGRHYLPEAGRMYDLGASTGNITNALRHEIALRHVAATSIDNSEQMEDVWRGVGEFIVADITDFEYASFDFCAAFLVFMFLTPHQQEQTLARLYASLNPGGAILIFDKSAPYSGYLSTVVHRLTLAGKVATGVPSDAIVKKELSLAGVQRPIDPASMGITGYGGQEIFRFGEFAGWIITK